VFQKRSAPAVADLIPADPAELAADRRQHQHRHDVEPALAGQDGGKADGGRPDEGNTDIPDRGSGQDS